MLEQHIATAMSTGQVQGCYVLEKAAAALLSSLPKPP